MLIRIILILGSIGGLVTSVVVLILVNINDFSIDSGSNDKSAGYVFLVFCIIFFTLNTYYILSGGRGHISLYFKRKKLEEEIKIQEAKNRLKVLQKEKKNES
ncbi:MAG: hypothetical protein MUP85_05865 [Candidatus Lokiarchaeota archaeon]|nr:hypothetical protein [Candidatus Lokiarchaeota archaeon]